MLMRALGRTGMKVAALCLGGNTFGWTTDQKASEAVLDAYVEAGGNFIDTADVYARWAPGNKGGESETVLGTWMAARRNRGAVILATKVCAPMGPGPNDKGLSRLHIMQAVEASRNTVISHGRLRMSLRSRPMVGSAVARMVLSIEPISTGSMAPMTNSRRSLWVSGRAATVGASMRPYFVSAATPDCRGLSSMRMMEISATVMVAAVAKNTCR